MTLQATVEDGVARLVLNHPPLNILTRDILASLRQELANLATDSSLRVVLFSAEGKHFSAGADVGEHLPPDCERLIPEFLETVTAVDAFPLPIIAAVQGRCLGAGFELIQVADIVIAETNAQFGQPEIFLGVLPPAACALLPDRCARTAAAEIVFTGDALSASEAARIGLVRRVVPDDQLESVTSELSARIARHSAAALRAAKRALRCGEVGRRGEALAAAERIYLEELMNTEDAEEGLRAFLEKRQPAWRHR
jgi:cyclohexa-1,5-dienecarbonyl-CoA hydratase